METTETLKEAVIAYRNGDEAAFETIYNESSSYLYTCIRNIMRHNDNMEDICGDILQETYMQIIKSIDQVKQPENFLSWAAKVAGSRCFKYVEKNKRYQLLNEDDGLIEDLAEDEAMIPESVMQDRAQQRILRDMIQNELTELQRLCVIGYYFNDLKQSEIAEMLGIPENTVKTNLARAKKKLKTAVECFEKKENTKLYTRAPVLLALLNAEIAECVVPMKVSAAVLAESAAVHGAGTAKAAGGVMKKLAELTAKQKLAAAAVAVAVAGAAVGAGTMLHHSEPLEDYEFSTYYILADRTDADTSSQREMPEDTNVYVQEVNMEIAPEIYLLKESLTIYDEEWIECGYTKTDIYIREYTTTETEFAWLLLSGEQEAEAGAVMFWVRTEDWESADKELVSVEDHEVHGGEVTSGEEILDGGVYITEDGSVIREEVELIEGDRMDAVVIE